MSRARGKAPAPIRVAIVGGGCASMAAAFELTAPHHEGRYQVTVYQLGWRLGGKGASGRGPADRIEEHGLHLWMGYYDNAFAMMRACYDELGRDKRQCPIAGFADAFSPANYNAVTDRLPGGGWLPWHVRFPATAGLPGDPREGPVLGVSEYLLRTLSLARTVLEAVRVRTGEPSASPPSPLGSALDELMRLSRYGQLLGTTGLIEALRLLESALRAAPAPPQQLLLDFLEGLTRVARESLAKLTRRDPEVRRLFEILELCLAVVRGAVRFRLATDPRGFDAIDDYDCREWLALNGASPEALDSAFVRGLYDLAFAYEDGDVSRPRIAAGQALRGSLRAFFTYRGAFFWKMASGMGDIVFAPLYQVLRQRGVRFEFFHRLTNVGLARDHSHVSSLAFDVQAKVQGGRAYQPLIDVQGLPCWPAQPDYRQLEQGATLEKEGRAFEAHWDQRRAGTRVLEVGEHFDFVVLGIGLGAVPFVCREILAVDQRWRTMVEQVRCVGTQAFQIWSSASARELGWKDEAVNLSGFVEPFDTWADMTHVGPTESWPQPPGMIGYFCSVLPDAALDAASSAPAVARVKEQVRRNAVRFLERDAVHLWPQAINAGEFRWEVLLDATGKGGRGRQRFATQYWRANVDPSDRYTLTLPGTTQHRLSPLDQTYDNLAVAGDWTESGLNMGCVEAAVMSGRLAAHALSQSPRLEDIFGFDHP